MTIRDLYGAEAPSVSIEIFPPKTEKGEAALRRHLERLTAYRPAFVSCTYGAGGSTRDKTIDWCRTVQDDLGTMATAHFTCVGSSREELVEWLGRATAAGVRNIMALRGDPPQGDSEFRPAPGGLTYANELVELIREHHGDVGIGVAGYPEVHQEASDAATDLANLARKVEAGADAVYTQLFYVNDRFLAFRDRCTAAGIGVPIVPGIMPITDFARIRKITSMCGTEFPADLSGRLEAVKDDAEAQFEIGVEHAISQCRELIAAGVPGIHFYVLNQSRACERIIEALGLGEAATV